MVNGINAKHWAIILALALLGVSCRFGNHVQYQNDNGVDGYYSTTPDTLDLCVHLNSRADETCYPTSTARIPSEIGNIFSDPVRLVMGKTIKKDDQDLNVHEAAFSNSFVESSKAPAVLIDLTPKLKVFESYDDEQGQLWNDPACTYVGDFTLAGSYDQSTTVDLGDIKTRGTTALTFDRNHYFVGDCQQTLTDLLACLKDSSQCQESTADANEETQAALQRFYDVTFQPYVDAGFLSDADIPQVVSVRYKVSYQ